MAQQITETKIKLSYPLWACDTDPHDASLVVVGGGGGPGNHGVGNNLTILNVSAPSGLAVVGTLPLPANEDSVQSLASGPRGIVFAGINGSAEEGAHGQNPHFRVFSISQPKPNGQLSKRQSSVSVSAPASAPAGPGPVTGTPTNSPKKKRKQQKTGGVTATSQTPSSSTSSPSTSTSAAVSTGSSVPGVSSVSTVPAGSVVDSAEQQQAVHLAEISRDCLFSHIGRDTYQRRVRLSQPFSGVPQLGAVSTGFSKPAEIVLFHVPAAGPTKKWWKVRGRFDIPNEAMDLDVVQTGPETYQLAYCDRHDIYTVEVSKSDVSEPKCVYTIPDDDGSARPSFRSVRYLSPDFLFAVANRADRKGVLLHGYRMPTQDHEYARLALVKKLKDIPQATGLAVRNLSPVTSPSERQGEAQYVIAVAGSDASISLHTLEYKTAASLNLLANLSELKHIKSVHETGITGLSFSSFSPPVGKPRKPAPDLSIKLASVSMANTAVVHSIPLTRHVEKPSSPKRRGPPNPPRYVVALKSQSTSPITLATLAIIFVVLALVGQAMLEARGLTANRLLPPSMALPLKYSDEAPSTERVFLNHLAAHLDPQPHEKVILQHTEPQTGKEGSDDAAADIKVIKADIHDKQVHGAARTWNDLEKHEQHLWKQRLKKTGQWVEDMGETVFKGVLFGEIGGAIGAMVGGAL